MTQPEDEALDPEPKPFRPKPAFEFEKIRALVSKFFKVYEAEPDVRGLAGSEISAFYVQSDPGQFSQKFEELRKAVRELDPGLMVILQSSGGEDVVLIARKPPVTARGAGLNLFLFIATILTTTLAGSLFYSGYEGARDVLTWGSTDVSYLAPRYLLLGFLSFSLPVMAILGIHELGHYFVAKRHHVRTSLPFFIPVPPIVPIGTFGAFISIREPIPDRKALFDIGAAGPIAGFLASIPVLVLGLLLTNMIAAPVPPNDELHSYLTAPDGSSWGFGRDNKAVLYVNETLKVNKKDEYHERIVVNASNPHFAPGRWSFSVRPSHLSADTKTTVRVTVRGTSMSVAEPFRRDGANLSAEWKDQKISWRGGLASVDFEVPRNATNLTAEFLWRMPPPNAMQLGTSLLFSAMSYVIPSNDNVLIHPTGFAGWVGLLVTGFNLLPAGQLDGGHVARAVLGNAMKWASYASIGVMLVLSYFFTGWLVMAILIIFLGVRHPPPLNDKTLLDTRRKLLAVLVLVILVVSFIPIPFSQ
jgi:Zn-dependent protease